jgi:hypothetical protein
MPTKRGFVQQLQVGRAGLVTVTLIHDDATTGDYYIRDIDADPERFNERLSKLGILRDAMNRAEPVEIEWSQNDKKVSEIDRAVRITRDTLDPTLNVDQVSGIVVSVTVRSRNATGPKHEASDRAEVQLFTSMMDTVSCLLDLQKPERAVSTQQLEMLRDAQRTGTNVRLTVSGELAWISAVGLGDDAGGLGSGQGARAIDGFVESLGGAIDAAEAAAVGSFALAELTTAPAFSGPGNYVAPAPFTPERLQLLVARGSEAYTLFSSALRKGLRVRVSAVDVSDTGDARKLAERKEEIATALRAAPAADMAAAPAEPKLVVLAAELLAPLASASRPVWVEISRHSIDHHAEGEAMAGTPCSDLSPAPLRNVDLPHPAEWRGLGCFNEGVYRFQLDLPGKFKLLVDGKALPLSGAGDSSVKLAHACLEGHHEVRVELEAWTCKSQFIMDVYRIR